MRPRPDAPKEDASWPNPRTLLRRKLTSASTALALATVSVTGQVSPTLAQEPASDSATASEAAGATNDRAIAVEAPVPTGQTDGDGGDPPVLLQADEADYDENANVVTARGNVEISQEERILLADQVSYNLDTDVITAEGNVSLLQPGGDVMFADRVQLTGDLKQGALRAFRMLMTDNSRVAAASAIRTGGNRTEMRKAIFSPCELCRDDPSASPLWQLRANKVVHDESDQTISYQDAFLEVFGVPIFYTPYFQHPDPTKERESGFLAPTVGTGDELGFTVETPYYWVISDSADLTLRPIYSTTENIIGLGTYRRRTEGGYFELTASGTERQQESSNPQVDQGDFRGHIDTYGEFDIDKNWRWGFNAKRSTDDTYLRVYDLDTESNRFLSSDLYAERFEGRNYFNAQALSWQAQRSGDETDQLPFALPELRYSYVSEPGVAGGIAFAETGALNLQRLEGRDTQRVSSTLGWELPHVDSWGGRTTLKTVLRLDGYAYNEHSANSDSVVPSSTATDTDDGTAARAFPQVALAYAYPLVRHSSFGDEVLEPKVQFVAGPNGGNSSEIPNEDSRSFEFEDGNLFALNRFPGRDRVSSGQRVDYGVSYTFTTNDGTGSASAFFGQSYRINTDSALPASVGEEQDFSDYVGSLQLDPAPYVDATYRFRLDEESMAFNRNEVDLYLGPPALNLNLNYSHLRSDETLTDFDEREELQVGLRTRFARYWSAYANHRRDLVAKSSLVTNIGLTYHDECFMIDFTAARRFYDDRDLEPETRFLVTFTLKYLGQFGSGDARTER